MITAYIMTLGLQNPRTYGPIYQRLPDVTLSVAANAGTSGGTALATQNTGIVNVGGTPGAGGLVSLPQMNIQAINNALAISNAGNSVAYSVGASEGGTGK